MICVGMVKLANNINNEIICSEVEFVKQPVS